MIKNISELLAIFNTRFAARTKTVDVFIDIVASVSGAHLATKDIVFDGNKVLFTPQLPTAVKAAVLLKKKEILNQLKNTEASKIFDIG